MPRRIRIRTRRRHSSREKTPFTINMPSANSRQRTEKRTVFFSATKLPEPQKKKRPVIPPETDSN